MRVLLVKPSNLSDHIQPSLGLGYLATAIRERHDVRIVDCIKEKLPAAQMLPILREFRPEVLGSQCYSMDVPKLRELLQVVKAFDAGITTIVGGAHATAVPEATLDYIGRELLDFVFVGEGEIGFPMFLAELQRGSQAEFGKVPGLGWPCDGKLVVNPRAQAADLDSLGFPAWDLIMPETYPVTPHGVMFREFPIAPVMATRGCPYKCTFCSSAGTQLRKRSVGHMLSEIRYLQENHGIREFHMVDDNFTLEMDYAKEFLQALIESGIKASWATPNGIRLDRLDKPLLTLMRHAGFYSISVGIESGSDRILFKMKKGHSTKKIRRDLAKVKEVGGIDVTGFFILGFPTETVEDIEKTIKFACDLPIDRATFHSFIPLPGTEAWREMEASGEIKKVDWEKYFFWAGAYVPEGMTRKQLRRLHRKGFLSFYLRPKILRHNLPQIRNGAHLLHILRYVGKRLAA